MQRQVPHEPLPGRLVERAQAASGPWPLLRAVRLAPADAYLRESLYRAWLSERPAQVEAALTQLAQAEALSPFNAVYLADHAELLKARGGWQEALGLAERAAALEPDYLQARLLRAEALLRLGRRKEASGELSEVGRRSAALVGRLNSGSGYDAFILGFDRDAYARLSRQASAR